MFETLNDRGLTNHTGRPCQELPFQPVWRSRNGAMVLGSIWWALIIPPGEDEEIDDEKDDITVIFLRCALMCVGGFLRRGQVYEKVRSEAKGPQTVISHLAQLESLAKPMNAPSIRITNLEGIPRFHATRHPDHKRIQHKAILRPALMAIAAKFDVKEATRGFSVLCVLGVRMLIASSTRTGSVEETMAKAAKLFQRRNENTAQFKAAIGDITPSDPVFIAAFETATLSKGPLTRYYLRSLEQVVQNMSCPWWVPNEDRDAMTLEHTLPEDPERNWPQFTEAKNGAFWRRIGNLCLLPKGVNTTFVARTIRRNLQYKGAPYELTRQISEVPRWTKETICVRQKGMAKLALKAWPL